MLQNATAILSQNATGVYHKMCQVFYYKLQQFYYKMRQILQIVLFITNCDSAINYIIFDIFIDFYDQSFPKTKVTAKFKNDQIPWITKGIATPSKKKQKLNEKFLKNRKPQNEVTLKTFKILFETVKKKSERLYSKHLQELNPNQPKCGTS